LRVEPGLEWGRQKRKLASAAEKIAKPKDLIPHPDSVHNLCFFDI